MHIGTGDIPNIVLVALKMCDIAIQIANNRSCDLYHTGFSMGGFLAQVTATYCNHKYSKHNQAICYDPPGAFPTISQLGLHSEDNSNRENITIYVTCPNVVN